MQEQITVTRTEERVPQTESRFGPWPMLLPNSGFGRTRRPSQERDGVRFPTPVKEHPGRTPVYVEEEAHLYD
ncbi:hypothetical protein [Halosegnis marinus]|uniref:Uncharacterized protein n=1 Tax=Halosegnis marinus TaxID=3034023 RepID=A0ABD5ZTC7_9EURY|nr:hypothetical protein [Halosegnis sp. DT85]